MLNILTPSLHRTSSIQRRHSSSAQSDRALRPRERQALLAHHALEVQRLQADKQEKGARGCPDVQSLIKQGQKLLSAGDAKGALRSFERARARGLGFSSNLDALYVERVIACNIGNGDRKMCIEEHERSLKLSQQAGDAELEEQERRNLVGEGKAAFAARRPKEALELYGCALVHGRKLTCEDEQLHIERVAACNPQPSSLPPNSPSCRSLHSLAFHFSSFTRQTVTLVVRLSMPLHKNPTIH